MIQESDLFSSPFNPAYKTRVAYFSMEFAVDQALKIYSGGLGFLAGSHLRSAYELKQNLFGVGILWKYGYYDQVRDVEGLMMPTYIEKQYAYLVDTGLLFPIQIHDTPVFIKAYLLPPGTFGAAPLFLLSTDVPENEHVSRTITHRLYDSTTSTRIAQSIVLGIGGATLIDLLNLEPEVYHMNEGHSLPLNFYLYARYQSLQEVQKRVVFTTHTPERAGNEEHPISLLKEMSFFYHLQAHEVKSILSLEGDELNYTLAALKFAGKANGVSQLHAGVAREMWQNQIGVCPIISITNAQNKAYWQDEELKKAMVESNNAGFVRRKKTLKGRLFKTIADQCGKIMDPEVLTMVWARRFAGYKRADLLLLDFARFAALLENTTTPIQLVWAGKPYPEDQGAIDTFNQLIQRTKKFARCAVLTGHELALSAELKKGSDLWLNTPRMYREASGTSGMTAAMNGSLNVSIPDGWIPEFAIDRVNSFVIPVADQSLAQDVKDSTEAASLMDLLEKVIIPMYYTRADDWFQMVNHAAQTIVPSFDSARMVTEYYQLMYNR